MQFSFRTFARRGGKYPVINLGVSKDLATMAGHLAVSTFSSNSAQLSASLTKLLPTPITEGLFPLSCDRIGTVLRRKTRKLKRPHSVNRQENPYEIAFTFENARDEKLCLVTTTLLNNRK